VVTKERGGTTTKQTDDVKREKRRMSVFMVAIQRLNTILRAYRGANEDLAIECNE